MQTFLPYPDFQRSAEALDPKRLGKQRVECSQLIKAIEGGGGWSNHPAAHMWKGYIPALMLYMDACVIEWVGRGYNNNYQLHYTNGMLMYEQGAIDVPPWFGDPEFHASHRRALLLKDEYYDRHDWIEAQGLDWDGPLDQIYWWPLLDNSIRGYVLRKKGDY